MQAFLAALAILRRDGPRGFRPEHVLFIAVDDLSDFPTFAQRYPDAKTPHGNWARS